MAKLSAKARRELRDDQFALPGRRYPIPDKSHAEAAIVRANEMVKTGYLSRSEHEIVLRKAKAVIAAYHKEKQAA